MVAKQCNWSNPPRNHTGWADPADEFYLVRCKRGTGKEFLYLQKRPLQSLANPPLVEFGSKIEEAWHRHDHQVDYQIDSSLLDKGPPTGYAHSRDMSAAGFELGTGNAANAWNNTQTDVDFVPVESSPDTTIQAYWNPSGGEGLINRCRTIACTHPTTGGSADYPHLQHQDTWVEFPPQYPLDTSPKQWTNSTWYAKRYPQSYYYLPQVMMHELGHIAGLGHAHSGTVMGAAQRGNPISAPTGYDLDGMKHIYVDHAKP